MVISETTSRTPFIDPGRGPALVHMDKVGAAIAQEIQAWEEQRLLGQCVRAEMALGIHMAPERNAQIVRQMEQQTEQDRIKVNQGRLDQAFNPHRLAEKDLTR